MCVTVGSSQSQALRFVAGRRPSLQLTARARAHLQRWSLAGTQPLSSTALTINFHPDRPNRDDVPVLEAIGRSGLLHSQFETGHSSGFSLLERDGVRVRRESVLFGGVYDDAPPVERPKYGAVNLSANPRGGWPRFGSGHWVLDPAVLDRCTFTVPGSHAASAWWGSWVSSASCSARAPPAPHRRPAPAPGDTGSDSSTVQSSCRCTASSGSGAM